MARAERRQLDEVDIDAPTMPTGLDRLRATRDNQRLLHRDGAADERLVAAVLLPRRRGCECLDGLYAR
jgi:hypothetical protein